MKLTSARVREFRSIWDSDEFPIGKISCLVGKNEAGKTALLQALYRLNPIVGSEGNFDPVEDYPRSEVEDYRQDVELKQRDEAIVIDAIFELEQSEVDELETNFGAGVLKSRSVSVSKGYARSTEGKCTRFWGIPLDERTVAQGLVRRFAVPESEALALASATTIAQLMVAADEQARRLAGAKETAVGDANSLEDEGAKAAALEATKGLGESEQHKALRAELVALSAAGDLFTQVRTALIPRLPLMMYFDEYYQMSGHDNIQALKQRRDNNTPLPSDHPLLGLIELARLDLDELLNPTRTQELKNKLEGASNFLSKQILKYWSQNKRLRMSFDVRPGLAGDPPGMQSGTNLWGEVFDTKHSVSTGLGTRSAGFVWFFSFLAWYSSVKKQGKSVVLLLDEPGLTLHGRAQEDLLRYFDEQIASNPQHQLIYTTHSPFMVDPKNFDRVRIVEDRGSDGDDIPREQDGTKVLGDVLEASSDSLFPLQGALGYNISQTLFVGRFNVIVEGASDLMYVQAIAAHLDSIGRASLDRRWTIVPVGGADKVPTFVALIGAQRDLLVATLVDFQKKDAQTLANLYEKKLLQKSNVLTFADFSGTAEADIEDMFDGTFYLALVNDEYKRELTTAVPTAAISTPLPRILRRLENYFESAPISGGRKFSHYRPARRFVETGAASTLDLPTLDRFERAFIALNNLLP